MSEIDKATKRLNDAADKATLTTNFFDELTTAGNQSDVTNPNNNKTVPSVSKQVIQVYEEVGLNPDAISRQNQQLIRNLGEWQVGLTFENQGDYATFNDQAIITNDSTPLPYTTQGSDPTVEPDSDNVVPFAEVNTVNTVNTVASVSELASFVAAADGQKVNVTAYHDGWAAMNEVPKGGGVFTWDSSRPKVNHNGGTIIDPDATFPTLWGDAGQQATWFESDNAGNGCWVITKDDLIDVTGFGAIPSKTKDSTLSFKSAIKAAREFTEVIYAPGGDYLINDTLFFGALTSDSVSGANSGYYRNQCLGIVGDGIGSTTLWCGTGLAGKPLLDMSGMRVKNLKKFNIQSDNDFGLAPSCAILTARLERDSSGTTNNDWGNYSEVAANGKYSVASLVAASEEESMWFKCQFTNTHNDAYSAVLLTHNLQEFYTPASNSEMPFATGNLSNLHQRFVNCDICMRANSPNKVNTAHVRIYGSLMVEIDSPFFDSYSTNHHCVYVESGGIPFIYGIHVRNANCHEQNKTGLVLAGNNRNCSWTTNSSTGGFTDCEVVIDGYTNNFTCNAEYGVDIQNFLENSDIRLGSKLNINKEFFIKNSKIQCDKDTVITTEGTSENTENSFSLSRGLNSVNITGSIKDNLDTLEYHSDNVISRNQKAVKVESDFSFMEHPLVELKKKSDNFYKTDFISCYEGDEKKVGISPEKIEIQGSVSKYLEFDIPANGTQEIPLGKRVSLDVHLLLEYTDNAAANIKYKLFAYNRHGSGDGVDIVESKVNGDAEGDITISHSVDGSLNLILSVTSNGRPYKLFGSVNGLSTD